MRTRIQRWGNSLVVRIPRAFAEEAHLKEGAPVELSLKDGKLVVAVAPATYTLEELLARVTPQNLHGETNMGSPMGKEVW